MNRICSLLVLLTGLPTLASAGAKETLAFNRDIRHILSEKCFACHGVDAKHREANLRLDEPAAAYGKGKSGKVAIVPGEVDESELWRRITSTDPDEQMPPPETKKTVTDEERDTLRRWIEQGAPYQKHWAFEAPVVEPQPGVELGIDHFLEGALETTGMRQTPEANRGALIRRVAFALTGLPPSIEELNTFMADKEPGAYERMVDRYLASKRYGEEMARHWLDVARYADTHGLHLDNERQMFAYRDWVVTAFNRNLPFDQFTIEQLAGDLLPNPSIDQLVATGFNRCNVTTSEGGSINEEFIFRYAVDRASTTAQAWLGLTAGCAVCHDHKFDPITAKDFYSLYAFFHSSADPAMDGNALLTKPVIKVKPPEYDEKMQAFETRRAGIQGKMEAKAAEIAYHDPAEQDPPPPVTESEQIWFEDTFPAGAEVGSAGHPTTYAEAPAPVFSGSKSLKRGGPGLAQDYYQKGAAPFEVPVGATFFVHVYVDPKNPTREIMIQFHSDQWKHRALWGEDIINFGKVGTTERHVAGALPKPGKWVRLEVPAEKMGLTAGAKILGYAFTVQDGTVYFDKMGVTGRTDPANDPSQSFLAWRKAAKGKNTPGVPGELNNWLKEGPEKARKPEELQRLRAHYFQSVCESTKPGFSQLVAARDAVTKERDGYDATVPSTFIWKDLEKPRQSFIMERGQYDQPGEQVEPNTPAVLPAMKKPGEGRRATRLDLAKWIVAQENPLTARVTVNRLWQQVFGIGLVKTSHDLGTQGEVPSHPELLDWLAMWFQGNNWDVKKLMRLMVTSDAFRRSSAAPPELWSSDPENRFLARGPRFRLDAEQIRDQALFAGGLLNLTMGGKGVKPYQPENVWEPVGFAGSNTRFYKQDSGDALYRRSLYTFLKRTAPAPFMVNFDAPNREQSCTRRERSNTPLQALQLMNDVQHYEAARGLAKRMIQSAANPNGRITFGYQAVLSREPELEELAMVLELYHKQLTKYQTAQDDAAKAVRFGDSPLPEGIDEPELAAWTLVANLILNLDESIVRN